MLECKPVTSSSEATESSWTLATVRLVGARCCVALVLAGCEPGGSASGGPESFEQRDSAGVLISVTPGEDALAPLGWTVEPVPTLELGGGDEEGEYLFRVRGVTQLSDGRVVVLDAGSSQLRFYDAEGGLLERVGGRGQGPGEFLEPALIPWSRPDSLLLFDPHPLRFQAFSTDGLGHRQIPITVAWPGGRRPPLWSDGRIALVEARSAIGGEARRGQDVWESFALYLWVDLESGARVRMDSVRWAHGARTPEVVVSIPYAAAPSATVAGDRALITDGRTPEIGGYDIEGRLRRLLRVNIAARPITPEMLSAWFESLAEHMTRYSAAGWRVAYEHAGVPVPDDLPVFTDLMVDELGWLWARFEVGDPSAPSEWMVFDTHGRARGTVRTPSGLEVHEIGDTAIIGVWQNELGVEHVRLHLLRRTFR